MKPLRLSERWAFERADARVLRALVEIVRDQRIVRHDLAGDFGVVMDDRPVGTLQGLTLHSTRARVIQSEPRGCIRTVDLLALAMRILMQPTRRRTAEGYLVAVAMARCLPFYYAVAMLGALGAERAMSLRFFSQLMDTYRRTGRLYHQPFLPALNRGIEDPFEYYRRLVELTCSAFRTLNELHLTKNPVPFRRFSQRHEQAVFVMRYPLQNDLHSTLTYVVPRRGLRSLSFEGRFADLRSASSLGELLEARAAAR